MDAEAEVFLARCCQVVNDRRFFGDIEPHSRCLLLPAWIWVIVCIIPPFPLLAPLVLDFRLPPESEFSRAPAQRRRIPAHYTDEPNRNAACERDQTTAELWKWKRDKERYAELSLANRKKIWAPTFSYCERLWCFVAAPITVHTSSALLYTLIVLTLTHIVTSGPAPFDAARWSEWVVVVYMAGFLALQLMELGFCAGTRRVHVIDLLIVLLFFSGWGGRVHRDYFRPALCVHNIDVDDALEADRAPRLSFSTPDGVALGWPWQMYRVCSFLCWLRMLRLYAVDKKVGTLVRSMSLLAHDIAVFIGLWGVYLVAFASALNGGLKPEQVKPEPRDEHGEMKTHFWWVLQTYLTAFGEGNELDDDDDWITLVIGMTVLLVLQLILKDTVFTAHVTTRLSQIHENSELQWMVGIYHYTNHLLEFSVPVPFNLAQHLWHGWLFVANYRKARSILALEAQSGLPATSLWALQRHLRNARFVGMRAIPKEVEAELAEERRAAAGAAARAKLSEPTARMQSEADPVQAQAELRDRTTALAHRSLLHRARARFREREREELKRRNQFNTEEEHLNTLEDQVEALDKKLSERLSNLELAISRSPLSRQQTHSMLLSSPQKHGRSEGASMAPASPQERAKHGTPINTQEDGAAKFGAQKLCFGNAGDATLGLRCLLGLENDLDFAHRLSQQIEALTEEWHGGGSAEDVANFEYVWRGVARREEDIPDHVKKQFETGEYHGGPLKKEDFDKGHDGKTIEYFLNHESSQTARLTLPEVVALRLYTTSSFAAINTPLRERRKHPFAMTVYHLSGGLKKLRTVAAEASKGDSSPLGCASFNQELALWRGVKDREVDWETFAVTGGTELAPMSTTPSKEVARTYARSQHPLMLRYDTKAMGRGCSIKYLSVFPKEDEYLYPPLTYLSPIRKFEDDDGVQILVVEPQIS